MNILNSLQQKLIDWNSDHIEGPLSISGASPAQWAFFLQTFLEKRLKSFIDKSQVIVAPDIETAEEFYSAIKKQSLPCRVFLYPGLEVSPYGNILSSQQSLYQRFNVLDHLSEDEPMIIVATFESILLQTPPASFFRENCFSVEISDVIGPEELATKLVEIGYSPSTTVEEPGSFSKKGEIFDIYPVSGRPIRVQYFDDMIEEIHLIDLNTQKTDRSHSYEKVLFSPSPCILSASKFRETLRENIPMPKPGHKNRFEFRKQIFSNLSDDRLFENYPAYTSLFFSSNNTLLDYFDPSKVIITLLESTQTLQNSIELFEQLRSEYEYECNDAESEMVLPGPEKIYNIDLQTTLKKFAYIKTDNINILGNIDADLKHTIELKTEKVRSFLNQYVNPSLNRFEYIKESLAFINKHFAERGTILISTTSQTSKDEIIYLLEENNFPSSVMQRTQFIQTNLNEGFYYPAERLLLLTDGDLFSKKQKKIEKNYVKNIDLFAEKLSTMTKGDYVVHNEYGVGIYNGLETLEVGDTKTDFLVIYYADNDKIYVPVYRMDLISKHADSSANLKAASLRNNKFEAQKSKAKKAAKALAFDLLKLHAERESSSAFAFSAPDHHFQEFELAFPFSETKDQKSAIGDILGSMQKPLPMDHLVCGDVGFGKTEVAMRAAFKAVLDSKQVAVLVPTTILALQHFNSFMARFKGFPVNIEFLSRLKSPSQTKEIKEKLQEGTIDIVIGTHKLLASTIKYKDLGLVIVDEEQRFGVAHKEKLKLLKSSVDFLTLTATPIPRTLQLAFLGLRDLSLIQTAPPKRQSIKSYIIKEDDLTIKNAIEKELSRGGQVFYVHNRVGDMEKFQQKIKELVPNATITIGHGQLPEKELEKRMQEFYSGKAQILLCTTIIESGLDIPNANTIIIDRADTYGLAQLHQLRGRIGRAEKKAYAYFVIPKTRNLTPVAQNRLKALQTYAEIGSGFSIASCDLEIRGAGDILGASQSGHIESIGLELYMELLKEAIDELKGEKKIVKSSVEINTPFPSYIPNHYISDSSERLKQYKRLANSESLESLESMKEELLDIFGTFPEEINNLFTILETKIWLQHCGMSQIQVAGKAISLKFDKSLLESNHLLRNLVVDTFLPHPKKYQFTPDYRVIYSHKENVSPSYLLIFAKNIAEQIVPC